MEEEQKSVIKEIEQLISKISESNTNIISDVTQFLGQIISKATLKDVVSVERKLLREAVDMFIKLNARYTSDLLNIIVEVNKQRNQIWYKTNGFNHSQVPAAPKAVFELKTTGNAGGTAKTAFLLNSAKAEPINCTISYSSFVPVGTSGQDFNPEVIFTPQSFELQQGVARRIDALIKIPTTVSAGTYRNKVTVDGFEDTFFETILEVQTVAPKAAEVKPVKITSSKPVSAKPATKSAKKPVTKAKSATAPKAAAKK